MSTDQINCVGAPQNGFPAFAKMFPASEKDEADGGVDYGRRSGRTERETCLVVYGRKHPLPSRLPNGHAPGPSRPARATNVVAHQFP